MRFSELAIRRPVLAIVLNIIILFFGVLGYTYLGVREYPAIDPPNITVRTSYTGANADIVESQITEPLEKSSNGGADKIRFIETDIQDNIRRQLFFQRFEPPVKLL